jgi:16S rRNA (cytosine1402-N4)-methyltransferase
VQVQTYHIPVLYQECLEALQIRADGVYVDCTYGGGGHSKGILEKLGPDGKLFAFDQDADAAANVVADERLVFIPHNFKHLQRFLRLHGVAKVDGVLADLGVSSHQFDTGERGFSTRFDGPLDMRMDTSSTVTAADVIATYTEQQLHKLFEKYGEVTNSKTLARHIVQQRVVVKPTTIQMFKQMLAPMVKGLPQKYWAQVFQALRIEVNNELGVLEELLSQLTDVIKPGGRAAIITFHSLEDRLVKNVFKNVTEEDVNDPFGNKPVVQHWKMVHKKPIEATAEELKDNPRSRSAKLRVAEKQHAATE